MSFTISVHTFFTDSVNTVDAVIGTFVHSAHTNFIAGYESVITSAFTFYIILLGYRFLTRTLTADLMTITKHFVTLLCVYGLIMNWDLYNRFVYNLFTNEPLYISQVLIDANGQIHENQNVAQVLNTLFDRAVDITMGFWNHAGFSKQGICFLFYGLLAFGFGISVCITAFLLFLYAKMAMAIFLALGPLFIIFMLWEATRNLFASWLRQLFTAALIPIVTSAFLAFLLSILDVTLPDIQHPTDELFFTGVVPWLVLSLVAVLVLCQVFTICAYLGGGIIFDGFKKINDLIKSAYNALKSNTPQSKNEETSRHNSVEEKRRIAGENNQ